MDVWGKLVGDLERNAINRDRIVLRVQVEAIPLQASQLAYRQKVLELLGDPPGFGSAVPDAAEGIPDGSPTSKAALPSGRS